jgi:hypothetical protein
MRTRSLSALALAPLVLAGAAAAAGGPIATASLTPDTARSASGLSLSLTGSLPRGVPSTIAVKAQPGFTSAGTKAVSVLCTGAQASSNTCPAGSIVGSGSVGTTFGALNFTIAAGASQHAGDLATAYLIGKLGSSVVNLPARLFVPPGGGLELLVSGFPTFPGLSLTSMSLHAKGSRTVTTYTSKKVTTGKGKTKKTKTVKVTHRTTYSLLANPSSCPASGTWTGTVTATYTGNSTTVPFTAACAGRTGTTGATGAQG